MEPTHSDLIDIFSFHITLQRTGFRSDSRCEVRDPAGSADHPSSGSVRHRCGIVCRSDNRNGNAGTVGIPNGEAQQGLRVLRIENQRLMKFTDVCRLPERSLENKPHQS